MSGGLALLVTGDKTEVWFGNIFSHETLESFQGSQEKVKDAHYYHYYSTLKWKHCPRQLEKRKKETCVFVDNMVDQKIQDNLLLNNW